MSPSKASAPSKAEIENLFINNDDFESITAHLNRFNPIRVMRMEQMEIRHSAILAWLLDPNENHGLADGFLRAFLAEALKGEAGAKLDALELYQADFTDVEVRREWKNIDIFVMLSLPGGGHGSPKNWAFVIENKVHSAQRKGQLKDYLSVAENALGDERESFVVQGVFLTLHEEEPDEAVASRYVCIGYDHVYDVLTSLLEVKRSQLGQSVQHFLEHYLEVIGVMTDKNDEQTKLEETAKRLYREHKKVLDFIMEHGAGSDFSIAAEDVFGAGLKYLDPIEIDGANFRFNHIDQKMVSFLPESWYNAFGQDGYSWLGCENWWAEYPLICWFQLWPRQDGKSGQLALYGEVGPLTEYAFRSDLIHAITDAGEALSKNRIKFQKAAAEEGKRYSKFFKQNFIDIEDVQDAEEIAAAMKKLLKRFRPEIDGIGQALPRFVEYGQSDA